MCGYDGNQKEARMTRKIEIMFLDSICCATYAVLIIPTRFFISLRWAAIESSQLASDCCGLLNIVFLVLPYRAI